MFNSDTQTRPFRKPEAGGQSALTPCTTDPNGPKLSNSLVNNPSRLTGLSDAGGLKIPCTALAAGEADSALS